MPSLPSRQSLTGLSSTAGFLQWFPDTDIRPFSASVATVVNSSAVSYNLECTLDFSGSSTFISSAATWFSSGLWRPPATRLPLLVSRYRPSGSTSSADQAPASSTPPSFKRASDMPRLRLTPIERRRALWEALEIYISKNGGWVTTMPGASPVRFEAEPGSTLPELLRSMGYELHDSGVAERFLPQPETVRLNARGETVVREHLVAAQVQAWEFRLPEIGGHSSR